MKIVAKDEKDKKISELFTEILKIDAPIMPSYIKKEFDERCEALEMISGSNLYNDKMKISDYLTIKEAAAYLGVTPNTIRNWERDKKLLISYRNPLNNYRLYKLEDLDNLLKSFEQVKDK